MNTLSDAKVMLVDDQSAVRELLGLYLAREESGFQVVGNARTAAEALEQIASFRPSIIIVDVFLPDMPALEFISRIREIDESVAVIGFCRWISEDTAKSLIGMGVRGIVVKDQSLDNLLSAIRVIRSGGCYIPAALEACVLRGRQSANALTEREATALRLIAEGFATKQMGDQMNISVKTAEKYRERIMSKLRLHDVVSLTRYAIRHGFATL